MSRLYFLVGVLIIFVPVLACSQAASPVLSQTSVPVSPQPEVETATVEPFDTAVPSGTPTPVPTPTPMERLFPYADRLLDLEVSEEAFLVFVPVYSNLLIRHCDSSFLQGLYQHAGGVFSEDPKDVCDPILVGGSEEWASLRYAPMYGAVPINGVIDTERGRWLCLVHEGETDQRLKVLCSIVVAYCHDGRRFGDAFPVQDGRVTSISEQAILPCQ
ncbi:MAG: hypothetical protein QXS68_03065 [Candidatus Methanomethylicaceae archaeon]